MIPRRWRLQLQLARMVGGRTDQSPGPRKFVLFAKQRSGSTWVIDLLNSHPGVVGYAELFLYDMWGKPPVGGSQQIQAWNSFVADYVVASGSEPDRTERGYLYNSYLDREVFCPAANANGDAVAAASRQAVGFKLMYNQAVSDISIPLYLQKHNVHCVHLIRRNHLDAILSAEAVRLRGLAHAKAGAEIPDVRINLEAKSIALRIARRERDIESARQFAKFLQLQTIELFYEDLKEDQTAIKPVLEFLGVDVDQIELKSDLRKLNSNSHRDLIANYDEVASVLKDGKYAQLLRD